MIHKIIYKPDKDNKVTMCCPKRSWKHECIELHKVNIKEQGKKRCNGCNSFLIPYGTWIISDLSEEEIKRSEEFIKEHRHNGKPVIDYIIHDSNGISCNIYIMCIICGKEKDITDYDRW